MSVRIVWPDKRMVPDALIEKWFIDAIATNKIPACIRMTDPQKMAEALEIAGIIKLEDAP